MPSLLVSSLLDFATIRLLVVVASALCLSRLMGEKGMLASLATAMEEINPKLALHFVPAAIGLVPMPAGALVSATAVRDLTDRMSLVPAQGTYINYWFRHIWEFSLPVYPAVIMTSAVLAIPISNVALMLSPMTFVSVGIGVLFSYAMLKKASRINQASHTQVLLTIIKSSWPIILLVAVVLLGLEVIISFPLVLLLLVLQTKTGWPLLKSALRYGLGPNTLFLLYSVMLYKAATEQSGAAQTLFSDMQIMGLAPIIPLVLLPMLIGLATAFPSAYVGITFPLLLPFIISDSGFHVNALLLAYVSGMVGTLISPLHLCLVFSAQYFRCGLSKAYRYIIPSALAVEAVAVLWYFFGG